MGDAFGTAESSELEQKRSWNDRRSTTISDQIIEILKYSCREGDPQATICLTVRYENFHQDQASNSHGIQNLHSSIWYSELDVDVKIERSDLNTRITELLFNTLPQSIPGSNMMILELDLWWCGVICSIDDPSAGHDGEDIAWHNFNLGLFKAPKWLVHSGRHSVNLSVIFGDYPRAVCLPRRKKIDLPWCSWKEMDNTLVQLSDGTRAAKPKSHTVQEWIRELEVFEEEEWRLGGW
jgi:hypothetical protein